MSGLFSRVLIALVLAVTGVVAVVGGAVSAQAADSLVVASPGATTGDPLPGSYVSVGLGSWSGAQPSDYTYQWLRDGVPIAGATTRDYLVQAADVAHRLEPVVTGKRSGYEPASFTGAAVTPRKLAATLTLEVRKVRKPGQGTSGQGRQRPVKRIWVAIASVQAERPWAIAGTVEASVGTTSNVVGSAPVVRDVAAVRIPWRHVRQGRHEIGACFTGSDAIAAACAAPVTIGRG